MARQAEKGESRTISELLSGIDLHGHSWCYTDLAGQSGFSVPPSDMVSVHIVIYGTVRIASSSGSHAELFAGDVAMVLMGEAHALRIDKESAVESHDFLRTDTPTDIPPNFAIGSAGPVGARVLSGRLRATWPGTMGRVSLPPLLRIASEEVGALLGPQALRRAGMGPGSSALLSRIAATLLVAALRADPDCRRLVAPAERDPVAEALLLIEANPSANWTVEKLARSVGMGRSSFAAQFTQTVGRAPMEVLTEHRMDHAAALLQQGKLKIAEIGEMAGYSSEAAFSRRFSRHFGMTPSQMRATARAENVSGGPAAAAYRPLLAGRVAMDALVRTRSRPAPPASPASKMDRDYADKFLLPGKRD